MIKTTVWILGDQLLLLHPALAWARSTGGGEDLCVLLVESRARTLRLPYQRKKLVLLFSAMRHYAEGLRQQGYNVDYVRAPTFVDGLQTHLNRWQPDRLVTMAASELGVRALQQSDLAKRLGVAATVLDNTQFLVGSYDPYPDAEPGTRVVLEHFYRAMRRHFDVLLAGDGQPVGGQWNYDRENRKPLPRGAQPPPVPSFEPDEITSRVMEEIEMAGHGVGTAEGFDLAVTWQQAQVALQDFVAHRLASFGPYEDAMSGNHRILYHSALSPYLNIGLLEPMAVIRAVEQAYQQQAAPINSVEGFIRQVLGWREYIYWQYWRLMPGLAQANAWDAQRTMPPFFWDGRTEMRCLQISIQRAVDFGYNHHIERLMLICNFCMLAGINPVAVNDWFLSFYVDAYEWVMVPNVVGMGLNADGGLIATKPYIASANYINRMSDYCRKCTFDHRARSGPAACPFNFLYWNFLLQHEASLRANPRMGRNVLGLRHLEEEERRTVRRQAQAFLDTLDRDQI